jgi:hypothetical protein
MEALLGISLNSYFYLKLEKNTMSYYLLCFLFNKIREEGGGTDSAQMWGDVGREVAQIMYTCK